MKLRITSAFLLLLPGVLPAGIFRSRTTVADTPGSILMNASPSMSIDLGGPGAIVFGGGDSVFSPGGLLAEWNPIPDIPVWLQGDPAIDDYPRDFAPGGLLVGNADGFQFLAPDLILAHSTVGFPILSMSNLLAVGVSPGQFAEAPVMSVPGPSAPSQMLSATALAFVTFAVPGSVSESGTSAPSALIAGSAVGVPEPGSFWAVLLGGLSFAGVRRRGTANTSKSPRD